VFCLIGYLAEGQRAVWIFYRRPIYYNVNCVSHMNRHSDVWGMVKCVLYHDVHDSDTIHHFKYIISICDLLHYVSYLNYCW